ncbi:MAG: preprotein translocase subunit SecG [Candidatus Staskawiczbacteria bacterium RIFOXYC1_FULL_37_43]|nr:MAG: preprotein translocase subunit SecG [Candidatus Staskawiczbacteria bacterium RIFCSPHIGHO2_01_FULL_37_17]OGZ71328.1 MAG: preprotein translocase subunit SecG [Candidatus Staskawiczbacteria bacterium RIFCSPLOWO2_01_FULL_37_19]OGZ75903.1 MAG: preprotein translocase subunit SecG [Candidatus Staskawiczbacteria bacterium RIFOXYA1_FULL_37_15]OGZ77588.1 MAG: preprotein translocase subunit SecG [Candidatus Staskawiczbacteria bacterium RIFOXYA12_FULL_37_10]OGZ80791.1 MAG: preprotein translocase su
MNQILFYSQIIISVALIALIAIQQKGAALGSAFGGGGEYYSSKRGFEKKIHYATIVAVTLFLALGILNILIP